MSELRRFTPKEASRADELRRGEVMVYPIDKSALPSLQETANETGHEVNVVATEQGESYVRVSPYGHLDNRGFVVKDELQKGQIAITLKPLDGDYQKFFNKRYSQTR